MTGSTVKRRGRPSGKTIVKDAVMVTFQLAKKEKRKLESFAGDDGTSVSQLLREICKAEIERRKSSTSRNKGNSFQPK